MVGFFTKLTSNFWGQGSPPTTQDEREKPFKVPTARPTASKDRQRSMSPVDRVRNWRERSSGLSLGSPNALLTPSPSESAGRARQDVTSPSVDLDGTTLLDVGEDAFTYNRKTSVHKKPGKDTDREETPSSPHSSFEATMIEDTANEETLLQSSERYDDLAALNANQEEVELDLMKKRALTIQHLTAKYWTQPEIDLYVHLEMRGYEPLLPANWEMDFNTLPEALFTRNEDEAYIRTLGGSGRLSLGSCEFRAQQALHKLIGLGAKVRDRMVAGGKEIELMAKGEIMKYISWSLADAGLDRKKIAEELVVVEARTGRESPQALQARMRERLDELADKHEKLIGRSEDLPALYGILLTHTLMVFIGYDPNIATGNDSQDLRTIATFNFKERDYDVWNSLAIAIVAMHTREQMSKIYGSEEATEDEKLGLAA